MLVEDIIHLARYSELNNIHMKDDTSAILAFVNLGIVELYKRFPLKRVEIEIPIVENQTIYDLPSDFMYATSSYQKVKIGSFTKDENLPLNDEQECPSVFFPSYNKIQISEDIDNTKIFLIYVPKPVKYTMMDMKTEVDMPEPLIDCLLHFIGYKAHLGIRSDSQSENNTHYARFERSIKKAKELGICPSTDYYRVTNRIYERGFV